jgi:hypothetical protein
MIAPRLLSRMDWEKRLHSLGCKPSQQLAGGVLKTGEFWETEHGRIFIVPIDNGEGMLRVDDFQEVLAQVVRLKPLDI